MSIQKVAVLGAGVMGSGIAAHFSNAGIPVVLLDIATPDAPDRSAIANSAVAKMLKTEPAPFMHKRNARLITTGNLEEDLDLLADCDWIVEAVIERLDIKRELYAKVDRVRKAQAVVSSNTSTIPLADLVGQMPEAFRRNFLITHFFNPPRYMRLLEVVAGTDTEPGVVTMIREFADQALGKGVVACKDTPGFIGNRIGVYWLQCAVVEALRMGITVEQADAMIARPVGIPKTGVFGLLDLVGLDLMPHILASMDTHLRPDDAFREYFETPAVIQKMIDSGYIGRKGKGGFYRLNRSAGKRVREVINLNTGEYHGLTKPKLAAVAAAKAGGLRALVSQDDTASRYAWQVLAKTLSYSASLVPEIAADIVAVDTAMKLGYNWHHGPFELIDHLGAKWFADKLEAAGMAIPDLLGKAGPGGFYRTREGRRQHLDIHGDYQDVERADGILLLADIKLDSTAVASNSAASLWDIGDGVLCFETHSKMNSIETGVLAMLGKALAIVPQSYRALVIYNEGENFSVGANLGLALYAANMAAWDDIEQMVQQGQDTYQALKYAPFPVIGAPAGLALGGGCEILLNSDALVAHSETYMGLVETGVGLIPGWGGCTQMLARWSANPRRPGGPMPPVVKVFETVSVATVAKSAVEARDYLFLRPDDEIVMNRDRVLARAKARALSMVADYQPPEPPEFRLPGPSAKAALDMAVEGFVKSGRATAYDQVVAGALATILSGGDTDVTETLSEADLLALERREFMRLIRQPQTLARIEHTMETGRPLRN